MSRQQIQIKYTNVSWKTLKHDLPYGLFKDYEVKQSEILSKWFKMREIKRNVHSEDRNLKKLRNEELFNVVCEHQDCQAVSSWKNRYNLLNFKSTHWMKQHTKKEDHQVSARIVSFSSTNAEQT